MSRNYPWLKDTIQYDPLEDEENYPQPQESEVERPKYRTPTIDKAVRVYTVAQESRFLIIRNIPLTNVVTELIQQLALFGRIEEYNYLTDEPAAPFTLSIWVRFQEVSAARQAKHKMNKTSFFGQDLWIQYAPEFESAADVLTKLKGRKIAIQKRLEELAVERPDELVRQYKRKARIPIDFISTGALLGEEEAIPAKDYVELQNPHSQQKSDLTQTSQSLQSLQSSQSIIGANKQPLKRKNAASSYTRPLPKPQESQQTQEPEEITKTNPIQEKLEKLFDKMEKEAEKKTEEVVTKPPMKKRRRI